MADYDSDAEMKDKPVGSADSSSSHSSGSSVPASCSDSKCSALHRPQTQHAHSPFPQTQHAHSLFGGGGQPFPTPFGLFNIGGPDMHVFALAGTGQTRKQRTYAELLQDRSNK